MTVVRLPIADRFWPKVEKSDDGCWTWQAARDRKGYGKIGAPGRAGWLFAHRVSYEIATGITLTPDVLVLHRCDNPPCVRPDHLFLGTHADNVADKIRKGRQGDRRTATCSRGHTRDDDNIYVSPSGNRTCKPCRLAYKRRWRQERRNRGEVAA